VYYCANGGILDRKRAKTNEILIGGIGFFFVLLGLVGNLTNLVRFISDL
jgi:hypothetical protein